MRVGIVLQGAVACVTGGGRGIGAATARRLADAGARVVIGDIDRAAADEVAATLGPRVVATSLDVTDPVSFADFVATARAVGPIDVLVNNAGVLRTGPFVEQSLDGQLREIAINLGGPTIGTRLVLDQMVARGRGHVVNVSSMAGRMSVPGAAVYTGSKSAVASMSRAVRAELAGTGVTLTTVFPAAVRTELTAGLDTRYVPTSSPDAVAKVIVGSCGRPRRQVTVPSWLAPVGAVEQLLPESLGEGIKRVVGAQRRITADNVHARAYQDRTSRS